MLLTLCNNLNKIDLFQITDKIYRISKARKNKRLAKYSWQHTLSLFRGCVLDLTTKLPQFSLSHSCVITTIPMSDSIIWLFLFNQPSPSARIIVIWAFGFHTATEQSRWRNWILCESQAQDAPVWGCACCLEPVNKWHYNAFCSQLQWLQTILKVGGVRGVQVVSRGWRHLADIVLVISALKRLWIL